MPHVGCASILVEDTFFEPMAALPPDGALLALDEMPVRAAGCAANVAIGLAKQGVTVDVAGCIGVDRGADFLLKTYASQGVGCSNVVRAEGKKPLEKCELPQTLRATPVPWGPRHARPGPPTLVSSREKWRSSCASTR